MDIIYFHGGCQDGWCAAFIAKMKWPNAELRPLSYGVEGQFEEVIEEATGKDVLMVDWSFKKREELDKLNEVAKSLLILDHHASQKEVLEGCSYAVFDNNRSGAGLAWDYIYGGPKSASLIVVPRPWWVDYTEDQDLWRFQLRDSRKINAWLSAQERSYHTWLIRVTNTTEAEAAHMGEAIRQYINKLNEEITSEVQEGVLVFEGRNYTVGVMNTKIISEPGEIVSASCDIAMGWFERHDGLMQFGLRSKQPGPIDVGVICKALGGGGHRHAGGFEMSIREGREFVDKILGRSQIGGWDYASR